MTDKKPYDIYATRRAQQDRESEDALPPKQTFEQLYADQMRSSRRRSFFGGAIVFGVILLIAVIVFQQYMLQVQPQDTPSRASGAIEERTKNLRLDMELFPQAEIIGAEMADLEILPIPEEGGLEFNARWIKQAAYYVILAEKSYNANELEDALEYFHKALMIFPNLKGVYRYIGLAYLQLRDFEAAEEAFQKAGKEDQDSYGVMNNLGVVAMQLKKFNEAEQYFQRAIKAKPDYALAYLNMATLFVRSDQRTRATEFFERYLDMQPDDIKATQNYATLMIEEKQWEKAIVLLDQIRNDAPDAAPIYFRLAQALYETGKEDRAITTLQRGIQLIDSRKALAWLSRQEFDPMRQHPGFQEIIAILSSPE